MKTFKIPEDILNVSLSDGPWNLRGAARTLREELEQVEEDIIQAVWSFEDTNYFNSFMAWTNNKVIILVDDDLGVQYLLQVPRNPTN